MKELHLIQVRHAAPFIKVLKASGAPVKLLAKQSGLALDAVLKGEGVIGERSLWRFIEYAAKREGREFLGYESAVATPVVENGKFGVMPLHHESSLKSLLLQFFQDAQIESSGSHYELVTGNHHSRLRRTPIFQGEQASWQVEQYMIQVFIQIIRICAGPQWLPAEIGVSSRNSPQSLPREWQNIRFKWGQAVTELKIPNPLLELPPVWTYCALSYEWPVLSGNEGKVTIEALVERQLTAGTINLGNAAEELGVSSATLKRRLRKLGTSYSAIVERCRYRLACDLLRNSKVSVREIAHDLGYKHPSNFARAFNRLAGVSPLAYRNRSG